MRWRTWHVGIKGSMVVICRKNGNYRSVERQLLQCWLGPWVSEVSLNKFYHYIIVTKAPRCLSLPNMSGHHITVTMAQDNSAYYVLAPRISLFCLSHINMSWPQAYHWYKGTRPFCQSPINMSWPHGYHWYKGRDRSTCPHQHVLAPSISLIQRHQTILPVHINMSWAQVYHWYKGTDRSACHTLTCPGPKYITDTKTQTILPVIHQHVLGLYHWKESLRPICLLSPRWSRSIHQCWLLAVGQWQSVIDCLVTWQQQHYLPEVFHMMCRHTVAHGVIRIYIYSGHSPDNFSPCQPSR